MNLANNRILVTGATGGIGRCVALALAKKGAVLLLAGRSQTKLDALCREIEAGGGRASAVACDLSQSGAPEELARQARARLGEIDVLVNCAGTLNFDLFTDESAHDLERLWRTNVLAPMLLTRALLPAMVAQAHGRIVNVGSIFGSIGFACFASYSASKFAMRGFSEALRRELEGSGVGVTYVAPRYTKTALNDGAVSRMAASVKMNTDEPAWVAERIVRAIEQDRKDVYLGWPEALFVRINGLLPRLVDAALRRQNVQMREFATESIK
jgi:short-subunit dehydrogenase